MYLDDITLGMEITTDRVVIEKEKMLAFANEYDPFPIHTDEEYAKDTRFGKIIAPGVMTFMSVWRKVVESDLIGDELVAGLSTKIEWHKPVFAGDVLYGKGTVTKIERRNPYNGTMALTFLIYNDSDECVMTSVIESVIKYR